MATQYIPVWQDYDKTMNANPKDYVVKSGGNTIYTGRAYALPGETYPKVRVNEIAAPLLGNAFPLGSDYTAETSNFYAADLLATLKLYNADGVTQFGDDMVFAYDWSGEGTVGDVIGMEATTGHRPIVAKAFQSMPLILTLFNNAPVAADNDDIVARTGNYEDSPFSYSVAGNYVLADDWWPEDALANGDTWISWGPLRFELIPVCSVRYVLYYVNAHGCWDSLPLEGKCREAVDYDRKTLKRVYDNSNPLARGTVNYLNEQTRRWTLRTGWVDALGASRMHHLIGSPSVYLMDAQERRTWPVVVTDTSVEERQYEDELAPIVYTINVQSAREGERR